MLKLDSMTMAKHENSLKRMCELSRYLAKISVYRAKTISAHQCETMHGARQRESVKKACTHTHATETGTLAMLSIGADWYCRFHPPKMQLGCELLSNGVSFAPLYSHRFYAATDRRTSTVLAFFVIQFFRTDIAHHIENVRYCSNGSNRRGRKFSSQIENSNFAEMQVHGCRNNGMSRQLQVPRFLEHAHNTHSRARSASSSLEKYILFH